MQLCERTFIRFTSHGRTYSMPEALVIHTEPHPGIPDGLYLMLADGRQLAAENIEHTIVITEAPAAHGVA
ncbi:hypothetical protein [Edwardsiella piscicida]|uniref:hypothetical protein n=1 Tax=Edwardsiella piscicida TaxID=1263550 RepID=UPI00370D2830